MNLRLALALSLSAVVALGARSSAAEDASRVLAFRALAFDGDAAVSPDAAKAAAAVVAKRCKHAGFEGVTAESKDGAVEVRVPPARAASEADIRRLVEKRAAIEFRLRAKTAVEDEWRDRRLQAGTAPPPGLVWCEPVEGPSKVLVEAPEQAAAARVDEAKNGSRSSASPPTPASA